MQPQQPPEPPVAQPAAAQPPGRPPRKKNLGEWGIVLGIVLATLGVAVGVVIPTLGYIVFLKNRGLCSRKLAVMSRASMPLAGTPSGPIGDKWCEGLALNAGSGEFTEAPADAIQRSRLALWRLVADPQKRKVGVTAGSPTVFHCPGATRGTKSVPPLGTPAAPAPDFSDPINQLYYSMFLQKTDRTNIPTYGTNQQFIILGDRSPASDGLPCVAGQSSANHTWGAEQTGQTVLYSAGNAKFMDRTNIGIDGDEIYLVGMKDGAPTGASVPAAPTADTTDNDDDVLMPVVAGS